MAIRLNRESHICEGIQIVRGLRVALSSLPLAPQTVRCPMQRYHWLPDEFYPANMAPAHSETTRGRRIAGQLRPFPVLNTVDVAAPAYRLRAVH